MPARLGLLGGTFDPIHLGHEAAGVAAAQALALDEVRLMPSRVPPHRAVGPRASTPHRFTMAALVAMTHERWTVSDDELRREGPSYTFDTLAALHHDGLRATQIFFLIGADAFAEIATWSRYPAVLDLAHFVVIARPGAHWHSPDAAPDVTARLAPLADLPARATTAVALLDVATPDVSSTEIRARAAAAQPLAGLVSAPVEQYIRRHGLYGSRSTMVGALHGQDE